MENSRNCVYEIGSDRIVIKPRPLGGMEAAMRALLMGTATAVCLIAVWMMLVSAPLFGLAVAVLLLLIALYLQGDPVETVIDLKERKAEVRRAKNLFSSILITTTFDLTGCSKVVTQEAWKSCGKTSIPVSNIQLLSNGKEPLTLFTVYLKKKGVKVQTDVDRVRKAIAEGLGIFDGGRV